MQVIVSFHYDLHVRFSLRYTHIWNPRSHRKSEIDVERNGTVAKCSQNHGHVYPRIDFFCLIQSILNLTNDLMHSRYYLAHFQNQSPLENIWQ